MPILCALLILHDLTVATPSPPKTGQRPHSDHLGTPPGPTHGCYGQVSPPDRSRRRISTLLGEGEGALIPAICCLGRSQLSIGHHAPWPLELQAPVDLKHGVIFSSSEMLRDVTHSKAKNPAEASQIEHLFGFECIPQGHVVRTKGIHRAHRIPETLGI